MPYLVVKRADIPDTVLQSTLDLAPNTSLKNYIYEPGLGQTGYQRAVELDTTVLAAGAFTTEAAGLTAWFLTSVSNGSGNQAVGSLTTIVKANFLDGEQMVISDGTTAVTFRFVVTAGYAVPSPIVAIDLSAAGVITADDVRDEIITAINAVPNFNITATNGGAATVTLTNTDENIAAATRNVAITDTVADVGFIPVGMAAATNSGALTVVQAAADSTAVLGLLQFGAPLVAAGALTLATINGAIPNGTITAAQVPEILQVLAGRTFTVPLGTAIEAGGAFTDPDTSGFFTTAWKDIRTTAQLRVSWGEGRLALARSNDFTYGGVAGAAVVVYNEDGTLFTVPV